MICPDCAMAADWAAQAGLRKVVTMFDPAAEGHDRCVLNNPIPTREQPAACTCQHGRKILGKELLTAMPG